MNKEHFGRGCHGKDALRAQSDEGRHSDLGQTANTATDSTYTTMGQSCAYRRGVARQDKG